MRNDFLTPEGIRAPWLLKPRFNAMRQYKRTADDGSGARDPEPVGWAGGAAPPAHPTDQSPHGYVGEISIPFGNNLLVVRMGHYDCIKVEYSIS